MRAARAVRRAVGVMLAGERDDAGLVIGVEQQVDHARAVPAGEHHAARPLREHGTDQLLRFCLLGAAVAVTPRPPALGGPAGEGARLGQVGVSTVARGRISSINTRRASGSSSSAPDSATITGSTTTGVSAGSSR